MPPKRSRIACERFFLHFTHSAARELSELRPGAPAGLPSSHLASGSRAILKTKSPSALGSWFCVLCQGTGEHMLPSVRYPSPLPWQNPWQSHPQSGFTIKLQVAQRSLFETSVNAHYVFLKTSKRVFRKCAFRFSKRNHPRVTKERRAHLYKLKKFVCAPEGKKNLPPGGNEFEF